MGLSSTRMRGSQQHRDRGGGLSSTNGSQQHEDEGVLSSTEIEVGGLAARMGLSSTRRKGSHQHVG